MDEPRAVVGSAARHRRGSAAALAT